MLALRPGRTVSTDRLAEGLWGERPPASAPKMVQLYVSHLRRLLDGNGAEIVTHGRGYELRLYDGDVDAVRFEHLLDDGRAREALALWRGEALADVADEPFAAAEIRRLEGLRLHAAELAIDADLDAGRHGEVIGELDALIDEHPLREQLHARRMLALYRCGRQAEALEAYRDARAVLVEQVGVEPGGELRRLQDAILAQDPALDGAAAPPPTQARPPPARPPPHRRTGALIAAAAVLLLAGAAAFGISRVLEPDGLPGIDENYVGLIDPDGGRITEGIPRRPRARRSGRRRRVDLGRQHAGRHDLAHRPRARSAGDHRRGRSSSRPGVRSGIALGRRRRRAQRRSDRPGHQQGHSADRHRQRAERRGLRRRSAVGCIRGRRDARSDRARPCPATARRSPSARTRPRWPPARARSGSRARRRARSPASSRVRAPWCRRSPSATARAPSRRAKARSGSSTATTGRSRGSTRRRTR